MSEKQFIDGPTLDRFKVLQGIDHDLDKLEELKGMLPEQISESKEKLAKLKTQKEEAKSAIKACKEVIEGELVKQTAEEKRIEAEAQQSGDQEHKLDYEAIEIAKMEIELIQRRIKSKEQEISQERQLIRELDQKTKEQQITAQHQVKSLADIEAQNETYVTELQKKRDLELAKIPKLLRVEYENLRESYRLVVAQVINEACSGCWIVVVPSRQMKIRDQQELISCESCGRILSHVVDPPEDCNQGKNV